MEQFLVYLWIIMPQFSWVGDVIIMLFLLALVLLASLYFVEYLEVSVTDKEKQRFNKILKNTKKVIIGSFIFLLIISLIPSRNGLVLLFSTPKIIELSKDIADNNRTKKLINILDNSLDILEEKTKGR